MHKPWNIPPGFCPDRDYIPAIADCDNRILYKLGKPRIPDHLIQLVTDPVRRTPQMSPDIGKRTACMVRNLVLRQDRI